MKNASIVIVAFGVILFILFCISRCDRKPLVKEKKMLAHINTIDDVKSLFPKTAQEIATLTERYIKEAQKNIEAIVAISADKRTFENTAWALDRATALADVYMFGGAVSVLKNVSPDAAVREAASKALAKISAFMVDWIFSNVALYKGFKAYAQGGAKTEQLDDEQQYFITETIEDFKRAGLDLPAEELEKVKKIKKELIDLGIAFSTNIANDKSSIQVSRDGLKGLDDDFIDNFKRSDDGFYILGVDYPTYLNVMENCSVSDTRKRMRHVYLNRAYPVNEQILKDIIAKRDELALLLGYKSFAHLSLASQMIKTPERAHTFLHDLLVKLNKKEQQEFDRLTGDLPESVRLTANGKMQPWDVGFAFNEYKKKHFSVDENKISEYFQLEDSIDGMFAIYQQFFGLRFEKVNADGFWHKEVKAIKVYAEKSNDLLAYLLLDLHPRPNKYSHAACFDIVPAVDNGKKVRPAVTFVVANFPKSTETKPSLLKRSQVGTLFHEFGHAIHNILGRTRLASFSGTATKTDFVELPSQMLEEWLWDPQILKNLSKHYKTGEHLSDQLISNIVALKNFNIGWLWQRQTFLSSLSLEYYKGGKMNDLAGICYRLQADIQRNMEPDNQIHMYTSFGHLTGYNARYYGYVWSRVLAVDVFEQIKKLGLLSRAAGNRYVETILGKGGSKDPNELLKDFLGRESNDGAFIKNLEL